MTAKSIFVTGSDGFIGANVVHYWLANHPQDKNIVLDALTKTGNRANLDNVADNDNMVFVHGDICDTLLIEQLIDTHQLNTIVYFAAESHVDRFTTGLNAFIKTNIFGTYSLLIAAKKKWIDEPKKTR